MSKGKGGAVRKSSKVGPDYAEGRYEVPWNASVDSGWFGGETGKSVHSPAQTTWDPPMSIHDGYDKLWHGK